MATRNFETREGFDFWDRLCKIPRYAFLRSKAGNSVQKAEGLGNWIDRDEAMVVMNDAQSEINVLRQDCATMIAELEDLRAQLPSQGGEAVEVVGYLLTKGNQLSRMPAGSSDLPLMTVTQHQRILAALSAENQRIVPVEPLLAAPHPLDAKLAKSEGVKK